MSTPLSEHSSAALDVIERTRKAFPAKYSPQILEAIAAEIRIRLLADPLVVDPFGGVGGIHALEQLVNCRTLAVELEPEFAACHERTVCGDSRRVAELLPDHVGKVDVLAFSPAYGNRFADQYLGSENEKCRGCMGTGTELIDIENDPGGSRDTTPVPTGAQCTRCDGTGKAKSSRAGYAIAKGARLTAGSGASLAWGQRYRETHGLVLERLPQMLAPGGLWLVNVSSIEKDKRYAGVMEWWVGQLAKHARVVDLVPIETARYGFGQNADARVPVEHLIVAEAPA